MSWVITIAGFAALIILHEFGHFMAAKRVGMRVERFYLFFPPKLASVKPKEGMVVPVASARLNRGSRTVPKAETSPAFCARSLICGWRIIRLASS